MPKKKCYIKQDTLNSFPDQIINVMGNLIIIEYQNWLKQWLTVAVDIEMHICKWV